MLSTANQPKSKIDALYQEFKSSTGKFFTDRILIAEQLLDECANKIKSKKSKEQELNSNGIKALFCIEYIKKYICESFDFCRPSGKYASFSCEPPYSTQQLVEFVFGSDPVLASNGQIKIIQRVENNLELIYQVYLSAQSHPIFSFEDLVIQSMFQIVLSSFELHEAFKFLSSKVDNDKKNEGLTFELIPHYKEGTLDCDQWDIRTKELMILSSANKFKSTLEQEGCTVSLKHGAKGYAAVIIENIFNDAKIGPKIQFNPEKLIKLHQKLQQPNIDLNAEQKQILNQKQEDKLTPEEIYYKEIYENIKLDYFFSLSTHLLPSMQYTLCLCLYQSNIPEIDKFKKQMAELTNEWRSVVACIALDCKLNLKDAFFTDACYYVLGNKLGVHLLRSAAADIAQALMSRKKYPVEIFLLTCGSLGHKFIVVQGRNEASSDFTEQTFNQWQLKTIRSSKDAHVFFSELRLGCKAENFHLNPTMKQFRDVHKYHGNKTMVERPSVYLSEKDFEKFNNYVTMLNKEISQAFINKASLLHDVVKALVNKQMKFTSEYNKFNKMITDEVDKIKKMDIKSSVSVTEARATMFSVPTNDVHSNQPVAHNRLLSQ